MTIEIPEDLAAVLRRAAEAQQRSVEDVAVERLRRTVESNASPAALLRMMKTFPHPSAAAVDDMEAAIAAAK